MVSGSLGKERAGPADGLKQMERDYADFVGQTFDPKLTWVVYWFGFFIIVCMLFFML